MSASVTAMTRSPSSAVRRSSCSTLSTAACSGESAPDRRDLGLVGERRLLDVDGDRGLERVQEVRISGRTSGLDLVTVLDEGRPGAHGVLPARRELARCCHGAKATRPGDGGHRAQASAAPFRGTGASGPSSPASGRRTRGPRPATRCSRLSTPACLHQPLGGPRPRRRAGAVGGAVVGEHRLGDPVEVGARRQLPVEPRRLLRRAELRRTAPRPTSGRLVAGEVVEVVEEPRADRLRRSRPRRPARAG